ECANVAPLANLDELASTGPGQGVQLLSVFQNVSQIRARWGKDRALTRQVNTTSVQPRTPAAEPLSAAPAAHPQAAP
ncbi:MAG: TraG/TraD/VirD4 family protein, partial [Actinobacteria bacterium]|nr:TraG/TraD/VirD4 family protein [Actinomycetota bacterium]